MNSGIVCYADWDGIRQRWWWPLDKSVWDAGARRPFSGHGGQLELYALFIGDFVHKIARQDRVAWEFFEDGDKAINFVDPWAVV